MKCRLNLARLGGNGDGLLRIKYSLAEISDIMYSEGEIRDGQCVPQLQPMLPTYEGPVGDKRLNPPP